MSDVLDDVSGLTVQQIDAEVHALSADLDATTDTALAGTLAQRRQALLVARPVAVVVERARAKQQHLDDVHEARGRFAVLEADLTADLRTQAAALDQWVRDGAVRVTRYRETARRLGDVEDVLGPPPGKREFHLAGLFDRAVQIDQPLEEALARAGVLAHVTLNAFARDPQATIEAYVVQRVQKFLDEARQRLPPPAADEHSSDEETANAGAT